MVNIFKDLLADQVVEGGQTMNPSVYDILAAINEVKANNVFVLPNNSNIILAANQAADLADCKVFVVPSTNIAEGIAAALQYNEDDDPDTIFENMKEFIKGVQCAEITHAVRSTRMNGFKVQEGDIIGICDKKIVSKSQSIEEATLNTIKKIAENKDVLTLYYGEEVTEEDAMNIVDKVNALYKDLEVSYYYGGQPHYYYVISAE